MKSAIIFLGIVFHFGFNSACAMDRTAAVETAIKELEGDSVSSRVSSLSLAERASPSIWAIQESIEEAHKRNDVRSLESLHLRLAADTINEEQWKLASQQLFEVIVLEQSHWQSWYRCWQRWETQSTWREAVLSALFFPHQYFLENGIYGYWENNEAVGYSTALSALYNNPQAALYYIEKQITETEEEAPEVTAFKEKVLNEQIAVSRTGVGRELTATYKTAGEEISVTRRALEDLAAHSVTALFLLADISEEAEKMSLFIEAGNRGYLQGYLEVSNLCKNREDKLFYLAKVPGRGYSAKWRLSKDRRDFATAYTHYLTVGEKGNPYGFYEAAKLMLKCNQEDIDPIAVIDLLTKSIAGGVSLAANDLQPFLTGSRRSLIPSERRASLVEKVKQAKTSGDAKRALINESFRKIKIL